MPVSFFGDDSPDRDSHAFTAGFFGLLLSAFGFLVPETLVVSVPLSLIALYQGAIYYQELRLLEGSRKTMAVVNIVIGIIGLLVAAGALARAFLS